MLVNDFVDDVLSNLGHKLVCHIRLVMLVTLVCVLNVGFIDVGVILVVGVAFVCSVVGITFLGEIHNCVAFVNRQVLMRHRTLKRDSVALSKVVLFAVIGGRERELVTVSDVGCHVVVCSP